MPKRKNEPQFLQAVNSKWYFRIEAANGESLVSPEQYETRAGAEKGFKVLRKWFRVLEDQQISEESPRVDGWMFWERKEDGSTLPLAFTDGEKYAAELRAEINVESFPASMEGRTALMQSDTINGLIGTRPPHRPK